MQKDKKEKNGNKEGFISFLKKYGIYAAVGVLALAGLAVFIIGLFDNEQLAEVEATYTPYITATEIKEAFSVWINVSTLEIRAEADSSSEVLGEIPYGEQVTGDHSGEWLNIYYNGTEGWIYTGKIDDERDCVVYSEDELYITASPNIETCCVWVNVSSLEIWAEPDFSSEILGDIPYGESLAGDIAYDYRTTLENYKEWLHLSYDGIVGYIYLGEDSSGRACVVRSEDALEPLEPTPTPYITTVLSDCFTRTVWINVSTLEIRSGTDLSADVVGEIPYGEQVTGDHSGEWLNICYNGIYGWIYTGETDTGRTCAVLSEDALEPLEPTPTAYITAAISCPYSIVWINVSCLEIMAETDSLSEVLGGIPYGEKVKGDKCGKWLYVDYNGAIGYIYIGEDSTGRACVVCSEDSLQPLD